MALKAFSTIPLRLDQDYLHHGFNAVSGVAQQLTSRELAEPFVVLAARLLEASRHLKPELDECGRWIASEPGTASIELSQREAVLVVLACRGAFGILSAHAWQLGHASAAEGYPTVAPVLVALAQYVVAQASTMGLDLEAAALG